MRILCASDASAGAAAAIDMLLATFAPTRVVVDLLAVAGGRTADAGAAGGYHAHLEQHLAVVRGRLEAAGVAVEGCIRAGDPAAEILALAAAIRPDLVLVGASSGAAGPDGSVDRVPAEVARRAGVPVLIARDGRPVRRIVLGYDESPDADGALDLLEALPWCAAPAVEVCSTWEVGDTILPRTLGDEAAEQHQAPPEDLAESQRAGVDIARDAAERLRRAGLAATPHARHGRASAELEILAALTGADLIAVGSRGLSAADRFVLGSTSDELVATARTSLLIVRTGG